MPEDFSPQGGIQEATDKNYAEVILSQSHTIPVVVDFWAPWCAPCKMMHPLMDQLAEHFAGKVQIVKVDADANPVAAEFFMVRAMPTFLFIRGGNKVLEQRGALSYQNMRQWVEYGLLTR